MTDVSFRLAGPGDKPRILEIASQVWDGEDYLPDVIDDWLAPGSGALVVAVLEGEVVGLARYDRSFPGYAWFEGLRVDPGYRNRGLAKALTGNLVERARADRAGRIGLSTYLDNFASQKVSTSYGFERAAQFVNATADATNVADRAEPNGSVIDVSIPEAAAFISASRTLRLSRNFLPHSWRFYPFARSPELALARMEHLLGIRRGADLAALLCLGDTTPHGPTSRSLDFMDGDPSALADLVRHAFGLIGSARYLEAMIPVEEEEAGPGLEILTGLGFKTWNEGQADVFVYERSLAP